MSAIAMCGSVVSRRIVACKRAVEDWKVAYEEVQLCRRFEGQLARAIEVFRFIRDLDDQWRSEVFQGATLFKEEDYQTMVQLYQSWLNLYQIAEPLLSHYEEEYRDGVEGAVDFREARDQARAILRADERPTVSKAIGLREMSLNAEASREIEAMLERAKQQPHQPVAAPETVDASFLLG